MNMKSLCAVVAVGMTSALSAAVEFSAFENPAKEHRPETWFHLIGGNVAKPGLDADLEALRDAHPGFPCAVIKFFLGLHLRFFTNVK